MTDSFSELEKLSPSELTHRAFAGVGEGVHGLAKASLGSLGLLALAPLVRKQMMVRGPVPKGLETQTTEQLADLAVRLSRAGGRDPLKGKRLALQVAGEPLRAEAIFEHKAKGRAPVDRLAVSKGVSPATMAHEVGHLTSGSKAGKLLRDISLWARKKPALALPGLLALTGAAGKGDKEEPHLLAKSAPLVGGAQLASILGEESRANIRGAQLLKKIKAPLTAAQKLKMFLPTATYLGKAGLLVAAPLGVLKGLREYNKARLAGKPMGLQDLLTAPPSMHAKTPSLEETQQNWAERLKQRPRQQ